MLVMFTLFHADANVRSVSLMMKRVKMKLICVTRIRAKTMAHAYHGKEATLVDVYLVTLVCC